MAKARPSKINKATINVKENELTNSSIETLEDKKSVINSDIEALNNNSTTIKTLNRDTVINMNGKSNILAGIKKEPVKKIEKRKVNIYLEEDVFNKLLYIAEINNNSMTATAGLLITNAIEQVFEENDLEFNSVVVDNYNEKIKNRVNAQRK